jgi:hypothetical protein
MTTIDELRAALDAAHMGAPELSIESAITVHQAAQAVIDAYTTVKEAARQLITDVMTETGRTDYATRAGKVTVTAPSTSVTYDAKALDILLRDDADLALRLAPYRKQSERAGSLRITGAK